MNFTVRALAVAAALIAGQAAHADNLVWDQGPATGTVGGSWSNETAGQNFADAVTLANTTTVDGFNYFTNFDLTSETGSSAFHLKILGDQGGVPGSVVFSQDLGYTGAQSLGNGINELQFDFTGFTFQAGQTYWVGLSGNGFEAAQLSVRTPQDGRMAQFSGGSYQIMTGVGDQMFQLTAAVPEPASSTLLLAGLGLVGVVARRRRRA